MREAGVIIGQGHQVIAWHLPNGRSGGTLPDSRALWDVLWDNRRLLVGFAHSHPGGGIPHPSHEDVTTFAAIEAALGCRLTWWIVSRDAISVVHHRSSKLDYEVRKFEERVPEWVYNLREESGMFYEPNGG